MKLRSLDIAVSALIASFLAAIAQGASSAQEKFEDSEGILRRFRAPAKECREAVKGFLWLEAEEFSDYGEWQIDTQFVHKMGSAYLITRGLPKKIAPAKTTVDIPSSGTWRVWVRTRDWLPEFSPGRFSIEIDGRRGSVSGASGREGWRWERAGDFKLSAGRSEVALQALADRFGGFARCDAVILTTDSAYVPPDGGEELAAERLRLTGKDATLADGGTYEIVVVGAGPAGLGSAIAAARCGARTILIDDRPVLGGNCGSEFRISIGGTGNNYKDGVTDSREGGIVEETRLLRRVIPGGAASAVYRKLADDEPLLTTRANERVLAVEMKDGRIAAVISSNTLTGKRTRYRGSIFVDGTGDGWLGYFAGAKMMFGREARSEYGEKDAPDKADSLTMSGCVRGYSYRTTGRETKYETPVWARILPEGFNRPDVGGIEHRWWLEHPGTFDDLADPERARDELIRIQLDYWGWLQRHPVQGPRARRSVLEEIRIRNGRREGWRIRGDYVLTSTDCREGRRFPDAITCGGWPLDIHDPKGVMNPKGNGWWSVEHITIYDIPYRCIYSKDIPNLFMSGRNISVTHAALGSTRIMGTIFALGQAAGTAAAMAVREGLTPREIGEKRIHDLQQQLIKDDQFIRGVTNKDPLDKARNAKVTATSTQTVATHGPDDMDFLGVDSCWAFSQWMENGVSACFPRGSLGHIEEVHCFVRNRTSTEKKLRLEILESDEIDPSPATRTSTGAFAFVELEGRAGKSRFVKFAFPKHVRLSKRYVWLKMDRCPGVIWFCRCHVFADGGCCAVETKKGTVIKRDIQSAFYTVPPVVSRIDSKPEYVIDGQSRPDIYPTIGTCTHAWRSDPERAMPQSIRLDFPSPVQAKEVRIVFDSGLTFGDPLRPKPKMLVKDYILWGLSDGKWTRLAEVKDNIKRLQVHDFASRSLSAVKVEVSATWGAPSVHIQEIRVY